MTTEGRASLAELQHEVEILRSSLRQSSHEVALLRAERAQFLEQLQQKDHQIDSLQHRLQQMLQRMFGRSAERIDPQQMVLFETLLNQLAPLTPTAEALPESSTPRTTTNGHGRRRLPSDLPRQKIIHDLPEDQKLCPCCGKMRHVIGQEISEQLEYVPAKLTVIEHVRLKYACRACEENAAESGPQIATAEKPLAPIEKGLAAPGLLAYVMVSKYGDHLPLHRLEHILARHGIDIARSTMCDWAAQCAFLLRPLYKLMVGKVLRSKIIHTDDTPVKVRDSNLDQTRNGRFWVYLGDEDHPYTIFDYTPSRSRDGPWQFLNGWSGHLQADAFGGYDGIYAGEAGGRVTEVACWAHARRKFYDVRHSDAALSTQALAYIRLLYDVEDEAKKLSAPQRQYARQEKSVPRLTQFKSWLEAQQASRGGSVLPKSSMGQAITYCLNQWDALCVYTTDGDLRIDNNIAENALRRVAIGRNNWTFLGSDNGGATASVLFTLIATCQRHKIDPFVYLRDTLTRFAATPIQEIDQFLPDRWARTHTVTNSSN